MLPIKWKTSLEKEENVGCRHFVSLYNLLCHKGFFPFVIKTYRIVS